MDAEEIKKQVKNKVKNSIYACGKSLKWAVGDIETFKFYEHLKCRREDMFFIFQKAQEKGSKEVREYLSNHPEFEKNKNFLHEKLIKKDIFYIISKSKNIEKLQKYLFEKAFSPEEIGKIAFFCGLSGSIKNLEFMAKQMPPLLFDVIAPNAILGAKTFNFPEVIEWGEKIYGKKVSPFIDFQFAN